MATQIRIFLDTGAILAGIWSSRGGGRMLLRLGETGAVQVVTSRLAVRELEAALREKAPEQLGVLALLLDRADLIVVGDPGDEALHKARRLVDHWGAAEVLAAAVQREVDYFVTLDREHFLDNRALAREVAYPIGTPAECLEWLRRRFRRMARS